MNRTRMSTAFYLLLMAVLVLAVLYPQLLVVRESLTVFRITLPDPAAPNGLREESKLGFDNFAEILTSSYYLNAAWNSLWISAVSVLAAALLGIPAAFLVERVRFPGRTLVLIGSVLPLALPPLVGVVAFFELSQPPGLLPRMLSHLTGWTATECSLSGVLAVLLVHAYSFGIYFFALTRAGLASLDPTLEAAARSLGADFKTRLRRVILPALLPYLIAAALLTFMTSMSSYSAPKILGAGLRYLTVEIDNDRVSHAERAAVVAVMLAVFNTIFLLVLQFGFGGAWRALGGGSKGASVGAAASLTQPAIQSVPKKLAALAGACLFCLIMALPFAVIGLNAAADHNAWNASGTIWPPAWTAAAFDWLVTDPRARGALLTSVLATGLAVLCNLAAAFAAAFWIVRGSRFTRLFTDFLCMLPIALPGTVIAFNLLVAFANPSWLSFGIPLSGTLFLLSLAYFVRQLPLAVRPLVAACARLDPVYEHAAQSLGATPGMIFRRILLPQLWPGILAAALLCSVAGLGEYVASVLLFTQDHMPISIQIEQESRAFEKSHAAVLSLVLVFLTVLILTTYAVLTRQRK